MVWYRFVQACCFANAEQGIHEIWGYTGNRGYMTWGRATQSVFHKHDHEGVKYGVVAILSSQDVFKIVA